MAKSKKLENQMRCEEAAQSFTVQTALLLDDEKGEEYEVCAKQFFPAVYYCGCASRSFACVFRLLACLTSLSLSFFTCFLF